MTIDHTHELLLADEDLATLFVHKFWTEPNFLAYAKTEPRFKVLPVLPVDMGAVLFLLSKYSLAKARQISKTNKTELDLVANVKYLLNTGLPIFHEEGRFNSLILILKSALYLRVRPFAAEFNLNQKTSTYTLMFLTLIGLLTPTTQGYRKTTLCKKYLVAVEDSGLDFKNFLRSF